MSKKSFLQNQMGLAAFDQFFLGCRPWELETSGWPATSKTIFSDPAFAIRLMPRKPM